MNIKQYTILNSGDGLFIYTDDKGEDHKVILENVQGNAELLQFLKDSGAEHVNKISFSKTAKELNK